jgi:undecaprenyl-diphosphatase
VLFPAAIQALDETILRAAQSTPRPIVMVLWGMSWIGGGWGLLVTVPFLFRRSTRMAVVSLLACELAVSGLGGAIKGFIERRRPCDALGWCPPVIGFSPGGYSFPSGHAAGSFVFAAFVSTLRPRFAPYLFAFAICVCASRVVLGLHYPSDVTGGAILGGLCGFAAAKLYRLVHGPAPTKPAVDAPAAVAAPGDSAASPADAAEPAPTKDGAADRARD